MDLVWVTRANYVRDYKIELTFNNGITGIVDLKNNINSSLFKPLKNKDYFKKFTLDSWTLTWDDKLDFSPEYLYELVIRNKEKTHNAMAFPITEKMMGSHKEAT